MLKLLKDIKPNIKLNMIYILIISCQTDHYIITASFCNIYTGFHFRFFLMRFQGM